MSDSQLDLLLVRIDNFNAALNAATEAAVRIYFNHPAPKPFPHVAHFALTVLTAGLWLPVWILHRLFSSR